ncbi:hypothetical protein HYV89_03515 [Candidatus Woesearchaeota archaeon]|nr:hypothetical protein [Candidatus Woesearchaeota archaeon]
MPEDISIEECVKYGLDVVDELTSESYRGDLLRYISEQLKREYPSINGKAEKVARSLYWTLICKPNSPLESIFSINPCLPSCPVHPVSHEYARRNGNFDKEEILRKTIEGYLTYIQS